jgi:hypothetical protein
MASNHIKKNYPRKFEVVRETSIPMMDERNELEIIMAHEGLTIEI